MDIFHLQLQDLQQLCQYQLNNMITIYMSEDKKVFRNIKPDPKFFTFSLKNITELVQSFGPNFGFNYK